MVEKFEQVFEKKLQEHYMSLDGQVILGKVITPPPAEQETNPKEIIFNNSKYLRVD